MGRLKQRTEFLMPNFCSRLSEWIPNKKAAKVMLGLTWMSDEAFWRVTRGDDATKEEVTAVAAAIRAFGKNHNFEGWKDLNV
jgi:hypothetical protein